MLIFSFQHKVAPCKPARFLCPWEFSRQEYWSGLPCPPPRDLPKFSVKHRSPTLQADSLLSEPPGKPLVSQPSRCFKSGLTGKPMMSMGTDLPYAFFFFRGKRSVGVLEGFPGGASGKEPACQYRRQMQVQSLGQEDPWRRAWQPSPVFLPEESHRQRSLAGFSP